jgi:WD40 repeat protein
MSVMMEHTEDIKSVAWHPNEELLASASYDNTIKLYIDDPDDDWYPFATLKGHDSTVWSTCFSPCGHYLASSSEDRSVRIWRRWQTDKRKGKWEQAVVIQNAHERSVFSVSWGVGKGSESGLGWVASTGGDGTIHIWEITTEGVDQPLKHELIASKLSAHGVRDANAIAWCPLEGHGQMLATAGDDHNVCIWKVTENKAQSC